jgi:hypothetical protein
MDDDATILGGMDVQLDTIGIEHDGSTKGGSGVFVFITGGAAVGNHARASHGLRYSLPFGRAT